MLNSLHELQRPSRDQGPIFTFSMSRRGPNHGTRSTIGADVLGSSRTIGRRQPRLQRSRRRTEGTIRDVRLRGKDERIIPGYAQLTGARAIVVDRHYGTTPLWRSTAVVARMSRLSPVPVLVLPSEGPRSRTMGAWQHQRGRHRGRYDARVCGRAANWCGSRGSTRRTPDDASCARELSWAFRFQRQRGMARRTATARPTKGDRETA